MTASAKDYGLRAARGIGMFFVRLGPILTAFLIAQQAVDKWWGDEISAWMAVPGDVQELREASDVQSRAIADLTDRVDQLGARPVPFVEFRPLAQMWPDEVRPGQLVRVVYVLRRNRACDMTVERRFQRVDRNSADPRLTSSGTPALPPLTLGFEVFSTSLRIPDAIEVGLFAFLPVLHCPGEPPVTAPPTFFEVVQ